MNPNPKNFPILSYVMERLPTIKLPSAPEFDVENPQEQLRRPVEPQFELAEKMPHLKNPKLISAMRAAVAEVSQTRSTLGALGTRPDHETVDAARFRLSEIGAQASSSSMDSGKATEDYKIYKAVISLDEMHEAYERMLSEAERRLEKIYEAAVAGDEVYDDGMGNTGKGLEQEELDEKVVCVLKDVELGKEIDRVDLSGRKLRIFPEAFGRMKSLLVLNLSNNQLEAVPDSIAGLENLEELYLAANLLESLPDSIGLLFKLKILDISGNKIAALPDSICHCRLLVELDANFNKLTYLPTNIGFELVNLERLSIHLNKIRSLPTSIGDMKSLRILDLHFNQLRGLPPSIGRLTSLETLNLSSNFNDLTELPETIADLTSLKELDISNNQIHELPYGFGRLMSLAKLNLDQNPLAVPPKEVAAKGAEAVKAYMSKRWDEILMEEERKKAREIEEQQAQAQAGLLARSASLLKTYVSNVSEYLGSPKKSEGEAYLNQQL